MSSRTWLILGALLAGLLAGLGLRWAGPGGLAVALALKPLGDLWLNGLQMTLVPLAFCLMAGGVAAVARSAGSGRLLALAIFVFVFLLFAASITGAAVAEGLLALWPFASTMSPSGAPAAAQATPSMVDAFVGLIPLNPVGAAATAAMAPLIVFAAIFGAAASRLPADEQALLLRVLKAAGDALLTIVGWVLKAAPVGVFVLAMGATARFGVGAAAGLAQYVLMLCGVGVVSVVAAFVIGAFSGVGAGRFLRAAAGPAALAASTQSSMACLPALVRAARDDLQLPAPLVGALMPLAVTVFRFGNVFGGVAAGLIGARLFGITPGLDQIALAVVVGIVTNIGVMGLPGAAVLLVAFGPIFNALGTPLEALTLLIAVFTLPDILDTTTNVTADLAATALISRLSGTAAAAPEPGG